MEPVMGQESLQVQEITRRLEVFVQQLSKDLASDI
jgi:hypothetical protein